MDALVIVLGVLGAAYYLCRPEHLRWIRGMEEDDDQPQE